MKFLPQIFLRSLRIKFSLLVLFLLLLVFSISSSILIYQNVGNQRKNLVLQVRAFTNLSTKPIGDAYSLYYDSGYLKFQELMKGILDLNQDIERVQIVSVTGEALFDSADLASGKVNEARTVSDKNILNKVNANTDSEIPPRSAVSQPNQIIEPYFEDFGAHPFSIRYFVSYDSISKNLFSTVLTTLVLSLLLLSISILLIVFVVNRTILNPIEVVIRGARKISLGDLSHTIEVGTKDEVEDLALAVNQMAQTLRKNIKDLQELDKLKDEFVFLASHNLRTPLTVIKGYLELIEEDKAVTGNILDKIEKIALSTKDLERITETLLSLVSLEKGEEVALKRSVDLVAMVEKIADELGSRAIEKKISFIFELPADPLPKIELDEARIKQALAGLIDNAIKFNKNEGKIIVKLERKGNEVVVSVADTGIGIPEGEKDKVFKKFHRATDVLTYNYTGIGLGLYLTKLIIESHQGKIWFESELGKGSTFYVSLPINP